MPTTTMSMSAAPPSADSAPPDTVSADKPYLTYKLDLIKTLATKAADQHYQKAVGMRVRELRVLRLIHALPGVAASELGQRLVLEKTLMSKYLADLEQRGLIQRTLDPQDNRVHRLSLTQTGQDVWQTSEQIGRALEQQMFQQLDAAEWEQLNGLLDQLHDSLLHWQASHAPAGSRPKRAPPRLKAV